MTIRTDEDHAAAIVRMEELIKRKKPSRADREELDLLTHAVGRYEEQRWPHGHPDEKKAPAV